MRFVYEKSKLFAARITLSKLTICYFIFSVVHCTIQVALQGHAFTTNAQAATFLWGLVVKGNAKVQGVLTFDNGLQVCDTAQDALSHNCQLVWNGSVTAKPAQSTISSSESSTIPKYLATSTPVSSPATISPTPTTTPKSLTTSLSSSLLSTKPSLTGPRAPLPTVSTVPGSNDEYENPSPVPLDPRSQDPGDVPPGDTTVLVGGLGGADPDVVLDNQCLVALNWPAARLDNTKREDIVFITFQFWVLGMSIVALLNESIPHIIASLFTHMVSTGWSAFQIVHTNQFRTSFVRSITNGACGVNLLPTYWGPRRVAEIASLALNACALLIATILSLRLTKAFGWRTFKRTGASLPIHIQYRAVLILSIIIQLSFFFTVTSAGLWLDQLINGVISRTSSKYRVRWEGVTLVVLVLVVPWLALGWNSARKEQRALMTLFLLLSALYLVGWGSMFFGASFRWTFLDWRFFSLMTSASVALTLSALVTGIVCRLGFGKGLPEHLHGTRNTDDGEKLFTPYVQDDASEISVEKVAFPPLDHPVPTFSAAFGRNDGGAAPERLQFPNPQMGPRFFNGSSVPFEPAQAHTRKPTPHQHDNGVANHFRSDSNSSTQSSTSAQRWVLE